MKPVVTAGASGLLFAIGLALAGMTEPSKVIGFLDVTGQWDPTLAFVMGGAMGTYAVLRRLIQRREKPLLAASFPMSGKPGMDRRLVVGSALFGIGWGVAGYCPGPGIVSVVAGSTALVFVLAMGAGMLLFRLWERASGGVSSS